MSASGDPPSATTEAQVRDDLMRLELYRNQLAQMVQQHQLLQASRADHQRARESLEGLDRAGSGAELLIPVGAETFVRGAAREGERVLVGIGNGVVVEFDRPKATELLAERLERLNQAAQELEMQMHALEERVALLSNRIEAMTQGPGSPAPTGEYDVGGD